MDPSVSKFAFSDWRDSRPTFGRSFLLSLTLHAAVTGLTLSINPGPGIRSLPEPDVAEILEQDTHRLIWIPPEVQAPDVTPEEEPRDGLPQSVTARDPDPQSRRQMARTDAPDISGEQDAPPPNVVSSKTPKIETLRFEPTQPKLVAPSTSGLPPLEAPQVKQLESVRLALAEVHKTPRLRFQAVSPEKQAPQQRVLEADTAPEITAEQQLALDAAQFNQAARLRYRNRKRAAQAPQRRSLTAEQASDIAVAVGPALDASQFQPTARLRYRPSGGGPPTATPGRRALAENGGPVLSDVMVTPTVNVDVSQLQAVGPLQPQGLAGETAAWGATAPKQAGNGLAGRSASEPGILQRSSRRGGSSDLASFPPARDEIAKDRREIDPEALFIGRRVYTTAVNMPNDADYKGDWVMHFAILGEDLKVRLGDDAEEQLAYVIHLTLPYPRVRVDAQYTAEAIREKVEGFVVFHCVIGEDGEMIDLKLLKSLDDRLDSSAREALQKWEFEPARKGGQKVAVEALIRVPFQLDPPIKTRY